MICAAPGMLQSGWRRTRAAQSGTLTHAGQRTQWARCCGSSASLLAKAHATVSIDAGADRVCSR
eukprot:6780526-Prymnesium_polylepis.1